MHPNPAFRKTPPETNFAFARERGFGTLSVNHETGPLISHIPFLLAEDVGTVDLHLVRSNPILKMLPCRAVIAVAGPDSYISPDWYQLADQVPTWNYIAIHIRGKLEVLEQAALRPHLDRLAAEFEARLAPKSPWTTAKMTPDVLERMTRMILPCRMTIQDIQGTWKLNQNKPENARLSAAREVNGYGIGQEIGILSGLMMAPPDD